MLILRASEKVRVNIFKTLRKDDCRMASLGLPQDINFEPLVCIFIFTALFSILFHQLCQKHQRVSCFIVLGFWRNVPKMSYKGPKVTYGGWRYTDVPRRSILNINTKHISMVIFSVLVYQICVLDTKKLVFVYSFSFGETSYERSKIV